MSVFKELNDLYKNDPVAFDVQILKSYNNIQIEKHTPLFKNIHYTPSELVTDEFKILFASRAVNEKLMPTGVRTHVEASVYYVFDKDGRLLTDDNSLEKAYHVVQKEMDMKYQ